LKDDWGDADLQAASVQRKEDASLAIEATAEIGNEPMGFRVVLLPTWKRWKPEGWPMESYSGMVRLESVGRPSEVFIHALARAYRQEIARIDFTSVELVAISLGGDPRSVQSQPVKLKLFFESDTEAAYAEAYVNFDLPHSLVQFHEKDPEYRKAVLGFLTRGKEANRALQSAAKAVTAPAAQEPRQP
jgi:hypothetical protein